MSYIKSAHTLYKLQYHVVWVCKYRRKVLKPGVCAYLRKLLPGLLRKIPGVYIETIGFDQDHLHMVMSIAPKYAVADVIGMMKSQSASRLRIKFTYNVKLCD